MTQYCLDFMEFCYDSVLQLKYDLAKGSNSFLQFRDNISAKQSTDVAQMIVDSQYPQAFLHIFFEVYSLLDNEYSYSRSEVIDSFLQQVYAYSDTLPAIAVFCVAMNQPSLPMALTLCAMVHKTQKLMIAQFDKRAFSAVISLCLAVEDQDLLLESFAQRQMNVLVRPIETKAVLQHIAAEFLEPGKYQFKYVVDLAHGLLKAGSAAAPLVQKQALTQKNTQDARIPGLNQLWSAEVTDVVEFRVGVRQILPGLLGVLSAGLREQMEERLKQILPDIVNGRDPLSGDFRAISTNLVGPTYRELYGFCCAVCARAANGILGSAETDF